MAIGHAQGRIEIDTAFSDDVGDRREAGLADMQKGNYLSMAVRQDVMRETLEGRAAGTARIDDSSDTRVHARNVGIDAEARESFKHMSMQIDQSGRDDATVNGDHATPFLARNLTSDTRDRAVLDRYIVSAAQALRGIDQRSAFQNEIIHRLFSLAIRTSPQLK